MSTTVGKSFTTRYNGLSNVLKNEVSIAMPSASVDLNQKWVALWDTGASNTVITKSVVDALALKPVSMGVATTPQGTYNAYMYYIDLYLPNHVVFPKLLVMEGQPAGCNILIGMDVIGQGDFAVSNFNGETVFSYRYPTLTTIDFVKHSYLLPVKIQADSDGPSKNSKCPCGSGKKYKQCCGKGKF